MTEIELLVTGRLLVVLGDEGRSRLPPVQAFTPKEAIPKCRRIGTHSERPPERSIPSRLAVSKGPVASSSRA